MNKKQPMPISGIKNQICKNLNQIKEIRNHIDELKSTAIKHHCPRAIGDKISVPIAAYVHIGKKAEIIDIGVRVDYSFWEDIEFKWSFRAAVLKKDGTPGLQKVTWTEKF